MAEGLETTVKLHVYERTALTGRVPTRRVVGEALALADADVRSAYAALRARRLLALDDAGEVLMAPPFSAVPTQHRVRVGNTEYWANCIWDAYGIAAALHADAAIHTECGRSGRTMQLGVENGEALATEAIFHYAVPAAHWWDDIVYT